MAKNTGQGHRNGEVRERSQVQNHESGDWVKRDAETGRFISQKTTPGPYKGVRREK